MTLLVAILLASICIHAQEVDIKVVIKNYPNDTLIIGNYYADRQLVKDTLFRKDQKEDFRLTVDSLIDQGVYLVLTLPDYSFVQFIVPDDDQKMIIKLDHEDMTNIKFEGSDENELFYKYLEFLKKNKEKAEELQEKIATAKTNGAEDLKASEELKQLDDKVSAYQKEIVEKHPRSIIAMLISANFDVDIPELTDDDEDEVKLKRFRYYRDHYFEHLDTNHVGLIRTPFLHDRIMYYLDNLYSPQADSIVIGIDDVLDMLSQNEVAYKFYTSFFLNKYAAGKRVGDDAVYVHMVDKYYSQGKAPWVNEETMAKIKDNAEKLRPLLIGSILPTVTTFEQDGTPVKLNDIDSEYTVLVFWAPSCGHCTKAMPFIVDFNDKWKDKGVKTISICTKGGEKYQGCWDALEEKDMLRMLNTGDEYTRFQRKLFVSKTPKIIVLNRDKKILIKDIPAEKLDEIVKEIINIEAMEKAKSEE